MDTLAGVLSGLWPSAAAGGRSILAATSAAIDEVLWGNADNCERLRSMFKAHAQRVKGAGHSLRGQSCASGARRLFRELCASHLKH